MSHCTKAIFLMHFQRPQCRNSKYYRWEPSLLHYNNLNLWIGGLKLKILYIMNRMHLHLHLQHLYLYHWTLQIIYAPCTGSRLPLWFVKNFGVCLVKIIRAIHTLRSSGAFYYTPTIYLSIVYHWTLKNIYAPYTGSRFPLILVTNLVLASWKSYAPYTL